MRLERAAFERAMAAYAFDEIEIPADILAAARASLDATGLFLVGEMHGAAETPAVVYSLARRLEARGLALEWSHDELDAVLQPVVAGAGFDPALLWRLPADAEALCADGRVTAGHVALLVRLREEARLDQLVLVDASGPADAETREEAMTRRLVAERRRDVPTLVLVGAYHALLEPVGELRPMGARLAAKLPGLGAAQILYDAGHVWFHGVRPVSSTSEWPLLELRRPEATPADVPGAGG